MLEESKNRPYAYYIYNDPIEILNTKAGSKISKQKS